MFVDNDLLMTAARADGRVLLAAAETDWQRPIPQCPDWDAADLVRHMGAVLQWMAAIVTSGERVSRRALDPVPTDCGDLSAWYLSRLERTVKLLAAVDPESPTWTFSSLGDHRMRWWARRLAVEIAIHRFDAEHARSVAGGAAPAPLRGEIARAGVNEFVTEFLPGLLHGEGGERLTGTLHLSAIDAPAQWCIDLDTGATVSPVVTPDADLRGTLSELLLWLTNRLTVDDLTGVCGPDLAERWTQLTR